MPPFARAFLALALLAAGPASAEDPGEAWARLAEAGVAAAQAGDLAAAERAFRDARAQAERLATDDPRQATGANNLAFALYARGEFGEAIALHREALAIRERVFGRSHPLTAQSLSSLGEVLRAAGHRAAAEEAHRRAVEIRRTRLPPKHPDVAESLNAEGVLLADLGRLDEAESRLREALAIRLEVLGERQLPVAETRGHLGALAFARGRRADAERWYREALATEEAVFGPDDPALAANLANLALTVRSRPGGAGEAAALLGRALRLRLAGAGGAESAETVRLRAALGAALAAAGAPERAREELQRSLAAGERLFGEDAAELAGPLLGLAALDRRERPDAAMRSLRRAAALRGDPPLAAAALHDLAVLQAERGDPGEADRLFARAAAFEGQPAPELARTLADHAALLDALGQGDAAANLLRRARDLEDRDQGAITP